MQETGTTCMIGVPRLYKLFYDGIRKEVEKAGALAGGLVEALKTVSQASHAVTGVHSGRRLFGRIHQKFGGRIRVFVSGGAALDSTIFDEFQKMGFPICEGYGLTETSPVLTVNPLERPKSGSVGPPLPNVEIRLVNTDAKGIGEIVARGSNLMLGYYRNEDATQKVMKDGWFHTGDLGRFDDDGYLYITGRVKDLIVTAAGKNVYPDEVELLYRDLPGVKEMTVLGMHSEEDLGEEVHVVIVPDSKSNDDAGKHAIHEAIKAISHEIPSYQRVQKVHFWSEDLPKTPSLKVKRSEVRLKLLGGQNARTAQEPPAQAPPAPKEWEAGFVKFLSELANTPPESIRPDSDLQ
jgi:long-chain acyl-CoA synthetase